MRSVVASALLSIPIAAALPGAQSELDERTLSGPLAVKCLVVNAVVTALSASAEATPFCSSFLGIQTATVSTTSISTSYITDIITATTGTDTVTAPTTTLDTVTVDAVTAPTTTYTETADAVTVTTCISTDAVAKRHKPTTTTSSSFLTTTTKVSTSSLSGSKATPACLAGLANTAVSLACSCLQVPTPTSTIVIVSTVNPTTVVTSDVAATATTTPVETPYFTPTVTPSTTVTVTPTATNIFCPSPTPDLSCSNQGVEFGYYSSPFGVNNDGAYTRFNPTYFKTVQPKVSGIAGSAGGIGGSCANSYSTFSFYGNTEYCDYIALNYRGYLYAGQSGTFTFDITAADDIVLVWVGSTAYSGWTRANALLDVTYPELGAGTGGGGTITGTYVATAGEYIPLRIVFSQGDGPFGFGIDITAPDGTVVLSADTTTSDFLVTESCDGVSAPAYAPYGAES
ncbi:hypothetical protein VM1G_02265 [Cytospora mali]|uniref:PA14 domain-containing protein n=1 Tax=Cytospora mali TaxID=578113 RepID=A0A194VRG6_CYTMA|nr:hypothetical protein VM1G_02265 [Valsa mali]